MDIITQVKDLVRRQSEVYKKADSDGHYDFWREHISHVYYEATILAEKYQADSEIVQLGALLHDIAQMFPGATKHHHEIVGRDLAEKILIGFEYPKEKRERVLGCVLHHRSSKNAQNLEEICVADADILAHFDNVPMLFDAFYSLHGFRGVENARQFVADTFARDFDDLSGRTKAEFRQRYQTIYQSVVGRPAKAEED